MSNAAPRPRPRPAHTSGTTRCTYTPSGARLVTVGSNNTIRLYKTGFDGEPANIDESQEQNVAVAAANDFFIVGSEDGTVSVYSIETLLFERFIIRTSLPVRDVALSPDGKWCAVASDELTVKVVGVEDNSQVKTLKDHGRPAKHVSFDPKGGMLAVSCTDGIVYIYSLTSDQPELIHKVDGVIGSLETDSDVSSKAAWHPDGRAFAMPTPTRDIQVVSKNDWEKQRTFSNGHLGDITAIAWSPNGAMLATAGKDSKLIIWETKTQSVIQKHDYMNIIDISWHPTDNLVSFTTLEGEAYICPGLITEQFAGFIKLPKQPAPFIHDPLEEISNLRRPQANGHGAIPERPRRASLGSLDSFLNGGDDDGMDDIDDFVVDDDGAGYTTGGNALKRPHDGPLDVAAKRRHLMQPQYHESFQPGSTPWRGNRKYLCLNLIGFVWTVDQDGHNTVTVEFYDHELHRDFHFTDGDLYDKACLTEHGTLFSSPPQENTPAVIAYRPHETWTQRHDWRIQLPKGEAVLAMSLSESFITVTTTANYVRVYSLFGLPYRVYRPKNSPMVTCASWKDYVLTMGNGSVGGDGSTKLVYTIENVKSDVICQNEDTVALPEGATLKSVFFSDKGDPCIYDSTGTLLTLLHWRKPSQASWIPLLDTKLLPRLAGGRKSESYYPIAVADNKFHCIILKGGDQYPYFPRPLLSEFDFSVPLSSTPPKPARDEGDEEDEELDGERGAGAEAEARKLEQAFLLGTVAAAQLRDSAADELHAPDGGRHAQKSALARLELEVDKTLLQLLAAECREGEERGMRALEMVQLMRDRTGRMVEAAVKVAERYGRSVLSDKIRDVGEKRAAGMEEDW